MSPEYFDDCVWFHPVRISNLRQNLCKSFGCQATLLNGEYISDSRKYLLLQNKKTLNTAYIFY